MRPLALLLALVCLPAAAQDRHLAEARRLFDDGNAAAAESRFAEAADLFEQSAAAGIPSPQQVLYWSAVLHALADQPDEAFRLLGDATDAGWPLYAMTADDPNLAALHDDPRWAPALAAVAENDARLRAERSDPRDARIVTDDITRFWTAYDRAAAADSSERAAIYFRDYVAPGSLGLLDYYQTKIGSAERLAATVDDLASYYADVRPVTLQVAAMEPQIRAGLVRLKTLYPEAVFPDVTFVIGRLSSGGTASLNGLLIGTEMYSLPGGRGTGDLPTWLQRLVTSPESLPFTVVHELVHIQQPRAGASSRLLNMAIVEGVADMVTALAMPGRPEPYYVTWGRAHEAEVWGRFFAEMDRDDIADEWIGNNGDAADDWPADLGYFVGSEIAWGYYDQAADKAAAIRELILMEDPAAILAASGVRHRHAPRG